MNDDPEFQAPFQAPFQPPFQPQYQPQFQQVSAAKPEGKPLSPDRRIRSDAQILRAAREQVQWLNDLPRHALEVAVDNGWITLSGEVTWDYQRQAAVSALRDLPGVAGLSIRVELTPTSWALAIRYEIEAGLRIHAGAHPQTIGVAVTRVDVSLSGTARSQAERDFARRLAANTPGVRRVLDNITIMPPAAPGQGLAGC